MYIFTNRTVGYENDKGDCKTDYCLYKFFY